MPPLSWFLVVGGALFSVGLYAVLARAHAALVLIGIELMLNAVTLNLVAFATYAPGGQFTGQVVTLFVIAVAAAEVGLAIAIIMRLFRNRATVDVDTVDEMRW